MFGVSPIIIKKMKQTIFQTISNHAKNKLMDAMEACYKSQLKDGELLQEGIKSSTNECIKVLKIQCRSWRPRMSAQICVPFLTHRAAQFDVSLQLKS